MSSQKKVGLFVTCLVDMFRPSVATSAIRLLKKCGFAVVVSPRQTCCGQVAFNNGDRDTARNIARELLYEFHDCDYIVAPSASCAGMVVKNYGELFPHPDRAGHLFGHNLYHFDKNEDLPHRADGFRAKFYELSDFLYHVVNFQPSNIAPYVGDRKISYHDSCSSLRDTKTFIAARGLLARAGVAAANLADAEACCGFGGSFTTDFPNISASITDKKCDDILSTAPDILLSADLGCLLHLVGRLSRRGAAVEAFHLIEFLDEQAHSQFLLPLGKELNNAAQKTPAAQQPAK
ncbi:MAG: (Fe-S)-binding protein [Hydrotalea sp.]|nr:(Fe-S)-binding protein [Hydrotalea sp.]